MLKIRLQRTGRKHEPTFRLVLTDSKNSTKSGKFLEILGSYDPRHKDLATFKSDRITHWISQGAQPSDTVHNLLINREIIKGEKRNVLPQKTPIVKETEEVKEVKEVKEEVKTEESEEIKEVEDVNEEVKSEEVKTEESEEIKEDLPSDIVAEEIPLAEDSAETPVENESVVEEKVESDSAEVAVDAEEKTAE